jgi:protein phosphatase
MPEDVTTCPSCGHDSRDPAWCDNCGARLDDSDDVPTWLEPGGSVVLSHDDHQIRVEIERAVDTFASRRVTFGRVVEAPKGHEALARFIDRRVLIEETETDEGQDQRIPDALDDLFRTPIAIGAHAGHAVRGYEDTGALTVEDLVDQAAGELSFTQIKEVYLAVLDAVVKAHEAGYLILAIAPWTVRVEGVAGNAPHDRALSQTIDSYDDPTIEAKLPDEKTLAEAVAAATATATEPTEADTEPVPDTTETSEEETVLEVDEEFEPDSPSGLESATLPSHDAAQTEEPNVDDLWDDLDDENALEDTHVLSPDELSEMESSLMAFFEGIDEVFAIGEEPYEVPVINGFSPPELLGRVRADVGEHCDVFILGMLLYYVIAGRVPPASVYTRYTPAVPARNYRPGFPPGLQTVIGRATRPMPADRFPSVHALRDAFVDACKQMERRATNVGGPDAPRAVLAVDTHVGIAKGKRNPTNQDSVFGQVSDDGHFALIVVADGVSTASYGSGDLASNFLTETAIEVWQEVLPSYLMDERIDEVDIIARILEEANEKIVAYVNAHFQPFEGNPHEVMGTTALIAVVREGIVTLASLGDSRVYLQSLAGLEQITADHNLWTLSILDGISADAALSMPHGDALARCLGTFLVEEGKLTPIAPEADFFRFTLTRGDTLLMTTDGLIDFAGANPFAAEENILAVMLSEPDPALACLELILLANRGGGGDNIGVGIAQFI